MSDKVRSMRTPAALLAVLSAVMFTMPQLSAAEVSDARLLAATTERGSWLHHGRDYTAQRFSPLDQITPENISGLIPAWIYQTGTSATFQTTPLVADGVMYLSAPFSHVMALDARTGREIWRYEHKSQAKKLCCGPSNRGVALGYGNVYVSTVDARLVALDAKTGRVVFDVQMAETGTGQTEDKSKLDPATAILQGAITGSTGVGASSAPLVVAGKVIAGITGVGYGLHLDSERPGAPLGAVVGFSGRYGRPGFLAAFDAKTGERLWQFDTTQQGWEGDFVSSTRYGEALPRDISAEKTRMANHQDAWKSGGGSIWHSPSVDLERGLLFFGVGNPSPQAADETRPGDNLYTVSLVAIDIETGKYRWHYQQVPHDMWGYDVASPPALFDLTRDGTTVPAVGQASKLGWYFVHDRRDGTLLHKSEPFVPQQNLFTAPSREGVEIAPGAGGGANWSPAAIDPRHGLTFVAAMHLPMRYQIAEIPATATEPAISYTTISPADGPSWGTLTAIDLANGKVRWQHKTAEILVGGTLATAGNLVFTGEGNGNFSAFDSLKGQLVWQFNCGAGVNAPPISYEIDGRQYVTVAAGGSQIWGFRQGGAVITFALPPSPPVKP